ncbi:hypothetical protein IB237_23385 [Agrobacterium sp. AGB01]|uniref:hypothetical protein n=1 Tax=Agrobacterium sp. AGB01 TaxID=2769302 RepID=UPI00178582CE|nr:hypothetical protein [Agrobacterium sp. AGB01]MBD9390148.1 hypothetical protein [Agrobacterium sp. AGB01]
MLARTRTRNKILLVIAPTLFQCRKTLDAFGVHISRVGEIRSVTKALQLRGWTPGTPFIAADREQWFATAAGRELSLALDALMLDGRVRVASQTELDELSKPELLDVR